MIMWCWRSNGSNHFKFLTVSLSLFFFLGLGGISYSASKPDKSQETVPHVATLQVKVTLIGLTAYHDFQGLKAALLKSEGAEKVSLDSEAPGLISFKVEYAGEPGSLIDQLKAFFPEKYKITQKQLPSGMAEINIAFP